MRVADIHDQSQRFKVFYRHAFRFFDCQLRRCQEQHESRQNRHTHQIHRTMFESSPSPQLILFLILDQDLVHQIKTLRLNRSDFAVVRKLTKGQFGQIMIVRSKTGAVFAMKTLRKLEMLRHPEVTLKATIIP